MYIVASLSFVLGFVIAGALVFSVLLIQNIASSPKMTYAGRLVFETPAEVLSAPRLYHFWISRSNNLLTDDEYRLLVTDHDHTLTYEERPPICYSEIPILAEDIDSDSISLSYAEGEVIVGFSKYGEEFRLVVPLEYIESQCRD